MELLTPLWLIWTIPNSIWAEVCVLLLIGGINSPCILWLSSKTNPVFKCVQLMRFNMSASAVIQSNVRTRTPTSTYRTCKHNTGGMKCSFMSCVLICGGSVHHLCLLCVSAHEDRLDVQKHLKFTRSWTENTGIGENIRRERQFEALKTRKVKIERRGAVTQTIFSSFNHTS